MKRPILSRLASVASIGLAAASFIATSAPPPPPPVCGDGVIGFGEICLTNEQLASGNNPNAVAIGDLDNDSVPDLVSVNGGDSTLSLFQGLERGGFAPSITLSSFGVPFAVELNDLDLDGNLDVIILDRGTNAVRVLLGNGNTTFQALEPAPTNGLESDSMLILDLNGDQQLDIATLNLESRDISILSGNNDGTFNAPTLVPLGSAVSSMIAADINNDGRPELLTTHPDINQLQLHTNQDGTFPSAQAIIVGSGPTSAVVLSDELDTVILVACADANEIQEFTAGSDGVFSLRTFTNSTASSLFVGDLNADGAPELIGTSETFIEVIDSSFSAFIPELDGSRFDIAFGDINADGVNDMAVSNQNAPFLQLFLSLP